MGQQRNWEGEREGKWKGNKKGNGKKARRNVRGIARRELGW
jgi:hypothetical protein